MNVAKRKGQSISRPLIAAIALVVLAGCSHYRVTDPNSGKVYYTTNVEQSKQAGYVEFTDAKTKAAITLQSSEVQKISKEEFNKGIGGK